MLDASQAGVRACYDAFAGDYDAFTAGHDYEAWTATLVAAARQQGLRGDTLLDVACGTGKSFLPLLDRGWHVTACDLSAGMLAVAAGKAAGRARLLRADMRRLPRLGAFALVTCLDDALNYLAGPRDVRAAFASVAPCLTGDGRYVFDV